MQSQYHSQRELMAAPMLLVYATTFLLLLLTLALRSKGKRGNRNLPSGSMGWPLLGETRTFLKPHPTNTTGTFMDDRMSRYGKIFMSSLFGKPTIVSADAELNRFILQNDLKLFEPGWPGSLSKLVGKTAFALQVGDEHKRRRAVLFSFLSNIRVRSVFLRDCERLMIMHLNSWKENSVIYVKDEAIKYTFDMMAKNVIGMDPCPESEILGIKFLSVLKGFISLPINLPGTGYYKALQSRKYILNVIRDKMEERIQKKKDGFDIMEDDFLSWVMENADYSPHCIAEIMLGMLFAGHDTLSKAIPQMLYFLHGCPSATEQLKAEHFQIVRSKTQADGWLTWDDYKKMEFTQCVITETLRLGNVQTFIQRKASTDINFKGYNISSGFIVTASFQAVHLDPSLFEDPHVFNPWRWQGPSRTKKMTNFLAFGCGPRLCPGSELARLEMAVFLHHLISSCNWELLEPKHPMCIPYTHFPDGLPMKIVKI